MRSNGHLQMCSFPFKATWQSSGPAPMRREGRSGFPGFLFLLGVQQLPIQSNSILYFSAPQVVKCVCWGNRWLTVCQLRDGFQTILCVCLW